MNTAVLVMAYGAPRRVDREEIRAYYTHIRRGRPPTDEALAELVERYRRIGGSPFMDWTDRQLRYLRQGLTRHVPGLQVYGAMKHVPPFIPDVARQMVEKGVRRVIALVLAPHESRMIIDAYLDPARPVFAQAGVDLLPIRSWHRNPGYLAALEARIRTLLARSAEPRFVLFTAHSLPERIQSWGDPYPHQIRETAEILAQRLQLPRWGVAYQSAGHTSEPWLGPDILEVLEARAREGISHVLVVPVGFVCDHLEILWDLDVEARETARKWGIHLERIPSLNDDPVFLDGLVQEVLQRVEGGQA
ncbi:MAG: ferrochelatase [Candidatus Hydrothermae bacterium]|nr:ferrochelatase [Candidatus Hydrothermae bacterium]